MEKNEHFFELIKKEMTITLATAGRSSVTMRVVSPAYYKGEILIFTASDSVKYSQLKENPNCCIAVGEFFAEATAKFSGATMLPENELLRDAYTKKFPGAFDEGVEFGGRNAEFILLKPKRLTGWSFENDVYVEGAIPTIPFKIVLE